MPASYYRDQWVALKKKPIQQSHLKTLSQQIAYSFLDYYLKDCRYEEDFIDLLCEMTTFADDPALNQPAAQALFGIIIPGTRTHQITLLLLVNPNSTQMPFYILILARKIQNAYQIIIHWMLKLRRPSIHETFHLIFTLTYSMSTTIERWQPWPGSV